jgi:hypothetical protein
MGGESACAGIIDTWCAPPGGAGALNPLSRLLCGGALQLRASGAFELTRAPRPTGAETGAFTGAVTGAVSGAPRPESSAVTGAVSAAPRPASSAGTGAFTGAVTGAVSAAPRPASSAVTGAVTGAPSSDSATWLVVLALASLAWYFGRPTQQGARRKTR